MPRKTEQLQIRVSAAQKARLRRLAASAGLDLSAYLLARALPEARNRVDAALKTLRTYPASQLAFAELSDVLAPLTGDALRDAVEHADVGRLEPFARNYVAATVEHLCAHRGIEPPAWATETEPLREPWFATPLPRLRLHLIRTSPVVFRRRNLFVDSTALARV